MAYSRILIQAHVAKELVTDVFTAEEIISRHERALDDAWGAGLNHKLAAGRVVAEERARLDATTSEADHDGHVDHHAG